MLLLFGLLLFGPDQLPKIAADLGRMVRELRRMARDASADLRSELGPEFDDVDLASLNPRKFIEKHLLGDDDDAYDEAASKSPGGPTDQRPRFAEPALASPPVAEPEQSRAPAPYDADAT